MSEIEKSNENQYNSANNDRSELALFLKNITGLIDLLNSEGEPLQNFFNKLDELKLNIDLRVLYETETGFLREIAHMPSLHPLKGLYPAEEFFNNQNIEIIDHHKLIPYQEFDSQFSAHPILWTFKEPKSLILFPNYLINNNNDLIPILLNIIAFIISYQYKNISSKKGKKNEEEFVSFASHQLKVPLTSIKTGLDMLRKQKFGQIDWRYSKILEILETEADNMRELISKLLDLSRIKSQITPQFAPVQIIKIVQEVCNSLEKIKEEKSLVYKLICTSVIDNFISDALLIKQVMSNLLHNASKFSPINGRILIILEFDNSESTFTMTIADEGPGIEEEKKTFIFNEYSGTYQISNDFSSSGIGLSICKKIAELLSGKIYVESPCRNIFEKYGLFMKTESRGAAFIFKIPIKIPE
jgi:signal transduction histidine kinase